MDLKQLQRSASPAAGRSSPVDFRSRNNEEETFNRKGKGYRRYASGVERALSLFDSALQEWADYISFLGRLLKALQSKPAGFTDVPHKTTVAKRLAQCLNPVLPSGVHQKALEVYSYVFTSIGNDGLTRDLSLYLPGLTPILSFASLSVKPNVLILFESYILELGPKTIRPALKAVILALLPGLEETSSEDFERVLSLLDKFKDAAKDTQKNSFDKHDADSSYEQYFWQCLFLASITSASRRSGALAYLNHRLPHLGSFVSAASLKSNGNIAIHKESDNLSLAVESVASPEPGLLIRCFCAGLNDEQLLIQRGFLDLLVTHLPLNSSVLQQKGGREDLERLVASASSVVARRDMSLNRRLWTWFLGPEPLAEPNSRSRPDHQSPSADGTNSPSSSRTSAATDFFRKYGLDPLISSIQKMITAQSQSPVDKARPLRICLSLMDRWEIGDLVVPHIFLPAMKSVWMYNSTAPSREAFAEVLRSASIFFDGVESGLIWSEITKVVLVSLRAKEKDFSSARDFLELVLFLITNFNIREEEMLVVHMPIVSLVLLSCVHELLDIQGHDMTEETTGLVYLALKITDRLLNFIPERAFANESKSRAITSESCENGHDVAQRNIVMARIERFYVRNQGNIDSEDVPITPRDLSELLLLTSSQVVAKELRSELYMARFELENSTFEVLLRKIPKIAVFELKELLSSLKYVSEKLRGLDEQPLPFAIVLATVLLLETVSDQSNTWVPEELIRNIIPNLISGAWHYLSPTTPKHNVEAVRCVWRLHGISPNKQLVESSISTLISGHHLMNTNDFTINVEDARRFATLWTHSFSTSITAQEKGSSLIRTLKPVEKHDQKVQFVVSILERPMMLLLDSLENQINNVSVFVINWLQSLSNIDLIVDLLVGHLQALRATKVPPWARKTITDGTVHPDDREMYMFYLRSFSNIILNSSNNVWSALAGPVKWIEETEEIMNNQVFLTNTCLELLESRPLEEKIEPDSMFQINRTAVTLLQQLLSGPSSDALAEMEIEIPLLDKLASSVGRADCSLQLVLMDIVLQALTIRMSRWDVGQILPGQRVAPKGIIKSTSRLSLSFEKGDAKPITAGPLSLPAMLVQCFKSGLTSRNSRPILENWVYFLDQCLPLYAENIFQVLLPLVECFCGTLGSVFETLQKSFNIIEAAAPDILDPALASLLNGLEQTLSRAHDRLSDYEISATPTKSPEQQGGFFGNMVSGVFASDTHRVWTTSANNRLTVLLCFKDAIRVCFKIWSWGDYGADRLLLNSTTSGSFNYTTLRLRNRTRRIFERLFAAETLECLETVIELWDEHTADCDAAKPAATLNLLNVLDGSRPKRTIPALFNAMYSRTSPNAIDPIRKSTLTSSLTDICLATFLVEYVKSLDDDAMDEIWNDCMTFLRDVLANPMPHRQTLPRLLDFAAMLGSKVDNTNFGDQRRMRRDLGDLFVRLLAATLTTRPIGFSHEAPQSMVEKPTNDMYSKLQSKDIRKTAADDIVTILASVVPNISKILIESDRIAATVTMISSQVLAPTLRSKSFPENITIHTLNLVRSLSRIPEATKIWKKDVAEGFNDPRFFSTVFDLVDVGWLPILRHWVLTDKDRISELLSRLSSPSSAGIVFGVGANSARLEADRKTQLNLRRISTLILAADDDTFVVNFTTLQEKLVDLLTATATSSPSSATRSEVYMVIRALVLKTSPIHLSSLWPTINSELQDAIYSLLPDSSRDSYSMYCVLHACKLLDTLLTIAPDDFQMQEWLFITDTIDAVYRPPDWNPSAIIDGLAEGLDSATGDEHISATGFGTTPQTGKRRPLLASKVSRNVQKDTIMDKVLRPFFRQLSIYAFESTYSMEAPDLRVCRDDLLADIFDDSTLV